MKKITKAQKTAGQKAQQKTIATCKTASATLKGASERQKAERHTDSNRKAFADLLRKYEQQVQTSEQDSATALTELATAVTYAVIKKCYLASGAKSMQTLRNAVTATKRNLESIDYLTDTAYDGHYTDSDTYETIADTDTEQDLDSADIRAFVMGDGYELVHDCIIAILDETQKAKERNGGELPACFLEQVYEVRELNRKVWIKTADSVNGWQTKEVTPIQQIYRAVRRSIENSRALQSASQKYIYLDETAKDSESNAEVTIYRRFGKYADIGGYVTDCNGKQTVYTTDRQTVDDMDTLIASLNLSDRQALILSYRLKGYGYKAIATATGLTVSSVRTQLQRIQEKAQDIGLKADRKTATAK